MASKKQWHDALRITSLVVAAVGWVLLVAGVAVDEWATSNGATEGATIGSVKVTIDVGAFRTVAEDCCTFHGQLVPELNVVCDVASACYKDTYATAQHCTKYQYPKLKNVNLGGSSSCKQLEGGSVAVAVMCILALLLVVTAACLDLFRICGQGLFGALLCGVGSLELASLVVFRVTAHDALLDWVSTRYKPSQTAAHPFETKLGASFRLLIAALVIHVLAAAVALCSWLLRPTAEPPGEPPSEMPEAVMTPPPTSTLPRASPVRIFPDPIRRTEPFDTSSWVASRIDRSRQGPTWLVESHAP